MFDAVLENPTGIGKYSSFPLTGYTGWGRGWKRFHEMCGILTSGHVNNRVPGAQHIPGGHHVLPAPEWVQAGPGVLIIPAGYPGSKRTGYNSSTQQATGGKRRGISSVFGIVEAIPVQLRFNRFSVKTLKQARQTVRLVVMVWENNTSYPVLVFSKILSRAHHNSRYPSQLPECGFRRNVKPCLDWDLS